MGLFSRNKKEVKHENENAKFDGFRAISTEGMDLSKPFVDDYNTRGLQYIPFGEKNNYPQILNQLYVSSPMHQACCNFKKYSLVGNGFEWLGAENVADKIKVKQFELKNNITKILPKIALDWIKHGRMIAMLHYNRKEKKYDYFRIVDPEYIRNSRVDFLSELPSKYFYSRDWSTSMANFQFTPYSENNHDEWQIFEIKNEIGGFRSYGMPDWSASANWQVVSADLGLLHKSAIENGIQPSVIWKFPYAMSPDERSRWEQQTKAYGKGAKNYGRAMKVEAPSKEQLPELEVVKTTDNHKLFEQTSKEQKEEIAISHGINPALMGVRIAGSLGQSEEIEFSARQFERIWVESNKVVVEEFINDLISICGIDFGVEINKTSII